MPDDRGTYAELPVERVWGEWDKWARKSVKPSRGLDVLVQTGWLRHFPEIAALRGTPQEPEWHPEGDVFTHTAHCLDALVALAGWAGRRGAAPANDAVAVLAHDFGKPATTAYAERRGVMRWTSPGHESAGGPLAEAFLRRIGAPLELTAPVTALVVYHLVHHRGHNSGYSEPQVRRLARKIAPATLEELALVMTADSNGRPPLESPDTLALIARLRARPRNSPSRTPRPGPCSRGAISWPSAAGPGRTSSPCSTPAFEAQLDGAFTDEAGAIAWLKAHPPA